MKIRVFKSIVSIIIIVAFLMTPIRVTTEAPENSSSGYTDSQQTEAVIDNKNEVIYANLASDGIINSVYVVNHFEMLHPGSIKDYGNYVSVANLTSTDSLVHNKDSVSFQADKKNFYYQGNIVKKDLPWIFNISYYMDGKETLPEDIAGKSGKLEIIIAIAQNENIDTTFYDNYMMQVSMMLDTEKCSNIKAPDATIASAGKNTVVAHTVMPGSDGDLKVTATVKDFTMEGIEITAMPFSINMELPETDDLIDDFQKLADAIADLNDGVGDLTGGVADLKTGAGELKNGSADFKSGLSQMSNSSGGLTEASTQIKGALSQIASSLDSNSSGEISLDELSQLPQGLTQLAQGLKEISGGLTELKEGFLSAYIILDAAIKEIPETSITQEQIESLYALTDPSQHDFLGQLVQSHIAGQTVVGTYNQVKVAFDAMGFTINTLSGSIDTISGMLEEISENIADALSGMDFMEQIQELSSGLLELSANYTDFHTGLTAYMDGVGELAVGYTEFHTGISAFNDGVGELHDGTVELHNGTNLLNDEISDMPDMIKSEMDDLMEQYGETDFEPISFTSPENKNTGFVQFVLKSDGIDKEKEIEAIPIETIKETFWDRFLALFRKI